MLKEELRSIYLKIKLWFFKRKWRKFNKNNKTIVTTIFPLEKVEVGKNTYGHLNVHYYKTDKEKLQIGSFCSIAENVHFFTGGEHDYKNISTFPFINHSVNNKINESTSKGPIIIEDDVWIGYGSIILSGVHIGKGAVIGAGSVVAKNVPPYAIFCNGKVVKYRFSEEIIKKLLNYDFSAIKDEKIKENINYLYQNINEENIDEILRRLSE